MLRFFKGGPLKRGRVGVFPGAYNPVTNAHMSLAEASLEQYRLQQVIFLLPQKFPHKQYKGASFEDRLVLLEAALADQARCAIASSDQGLFIEIARVVREICGAKVEIFLLCGRDAAERVVNWDYGDGPSFAEQLEEFQMLVASREGQFDPPPEYQGKIHGVDLPDSYDEISSTRVREALRADEPWKHLVPEPVAAEILNRGLYTDSGDRSRQTNSGE